MANLEYPDIMVDIETGGTSPDTTPILQIAAVKFNLEKRTVCSDVFEACLTIPDNRNWDESTMTWWLQQKRSVLEDILQRAKPWKDVLEEFNNFTRSTPSLRFWSKPITFDYMFISSYFKQADMFMPMHYRVARDVNTYIEACFAGDKDAELKINEVNSFRMEADAHNALNDVFYQIQLLFNARDLKEGKSQ